MGAAEAVENLEALLAAAKREATTDVFDRLEMRIVNYHAALKLELAKLMKASNDEKRPYEARDKMRHEAQTLRATIVGVQYLAAHISWLCEVEFHGVHRRRLETLMLEDVEGG